MRKNQKALLAKWEGVPVGTEVVVTKDDGTEVRAKTESEAYLMGGHSAVIMLTGIRGCYALGRVRRATGGERWGDNKERYQIIGTAHFMRDLGAPLEDIAEVCDATVEEVKGALRCKRPKWDDNGNLVHDI